MYFEYVSNCTFLLILCLNICAVYHKVDPREVRARLDTPRVRNILLMGYTVAELTAAIEQQLRKTGLVIFTTVIFLLQTLIKSRNQMANIKILFTIQ